MGLERQRVPSEVSADPSDFLRYVVVKREDGIMDLPAIECPLELMEEVTAKLPVLEVGMYLVCSLNKINFFDLIKEHQCSLGDSVQKASALVSADPRHNISCNQ